MSSKFLFCILIQISIKFVPKDFIDTKSSLVQVMIYFGIKQASSYYLNQWWPRSIKPYESLGHNELIAGKIDYFLMFDISPENSHD